MSQFVFNRFKAGQRTQRNRPSRNNLPNVDAIVLSDVEARERNRQDYMSYIANWRKGYNTVVQDIRTCKAEIRNPNNSYAKIAIYMRSLEAFRAIARSMMIAREAVKAGRPAKQETGEYTQELIENEVLNGYN